MDPYLEDPDLWPDVHAELIVDIRQHLAPKLRPRYVARVEQRTFLFWPNDPAEELYLVPDGANRRVQTTRGHSSERRERRRGNDRNDDADRRDRNGSEECRSALSGDPRCERPADHNSHRTTKPLEQRSRFAGRRALLRKRERVAASDASWVEIDLLRRGTRTIGLPGVPASAYRAYSDRTTADERRQLVWPIALRERLPQLGIPLEPEETEVTLDLQEVLDGAYDQAAYDLGLDYARPPNPPLGNDDEQWADALLRQKKLRA